MYVWQETFKSLARANGQKINAKASDPDGSIQQILHKYEITNKARLTTT